MGSFFRLQVYDIVSPHVKDWIPVVSGIPDSLRCIPDFISNFSRIPESEFPYMGRNGTVFTSRSIYKGREIRTFHSIKRPKRADICILWL